MDSFESLGSCRFWFRGRAKVERLLKVEEGGGIISPEISMIHFRAGLLQEENILMHRILIVLIHLL